MLYSQTGFIRIGRFYELNALSGGSLVNYTSLTSNIDKPGRWVIPLFDNVTGKTMYIHIRSNLFQTICM